MLSKLEVRSLADHLKVAETGVSPNRRLLLLRLALIVVFLWFGCMKFTAYEANGNAGLIANSPIMFWLNIVFGIQGASDLIGTIELATAVMLAAGAFIPLASAIGAAMACCTFVITLTFFISTPGVFEPMAGGFPAISALPGQFLLKDLVLLAASFTLLHASLDWRSARVVSQS